MSRAYRIRVQESLRRRIAAEDAVTTQLELLEVLPPEQMADLLHYSEETRIGALMAMSAITSSIQLSVGLFATIPHLLRQTDFHLAKCERG